ncbi:MAG: asparagine synthase (glutamine-hydrolyzing) [Snowella sp.]|nr:asparagine synthase (glutamine-hydrolyzing) [Snowella sp.]
MCGIAGFTFRDVQSEKLGKSEIEFMVASLKHRGPDGDGCLIQQNIALGHTRLSIIDLAGGAQPMQNLDGNLAITFNGEIYNYRELKSYLLTHGHQFQTQSDTEVILNAYAQWGVDCVTHLRGMFAFAIADYRNQTLFLARDHFGIKPLVYTYLDHRLAFASEIQALRTLPWVNRQLTHDPQAIYEFLRYTYIAAPRTGFRQIRKLPPAHYLVFDLKQPEQEPKPICYWQPSFNPDYSLSEAQWQERFEATIAESVSAHLVADVPFGAFLSGGLDSTLVTSQMTQLLDRPVKTFTIGFNEAAYDERKYAQTAAETLSTHHHERVISANALELLPQLVRHYGEPFGDCSAIPTWHVSQLARSQVPMVLTGDGGDEFFAGYPRYYAWLNATNPPQRPAWKRQLRNLATRFLPHRYPPDSNPRTLELWARLASFIDTNTLTNLWRHDVYPIHPFPEAMESAFRSGSSLNRISQAQITDIQSYMTYSILTKVDIASMMHGLECRTPLVDINVAELAFTIPPNFLIKKNKSFPKHDWSGKLPIKKKLSQKLDNSFINRPKQGFGIPLEDWLFGSSKVSRQVDEQLLDVHNPIYQFLESQEVKVLLTQKRGWPTWNLLFLSEWLQQK